MFHTDGRAERERKIEGSSISTVAPVGSSVGALYQKLYISQKVLLRMGEFVARNI